MRLIQNEDGTVELRECGTLVEGPCAIEQLTECGDLSPEWTPERFRSWLASSDFRAVCGKTAQIEALELWDGEQ